MSYVNAPIHDLLIRIKNAYMARRTDLSDITFSKFKCNILDLLKRYNFIKNFEIIEKNNKKSIKVYLKTVENPINDIPEIKFFSKPSRPWYVSYKDIKTVAGGKGIGIISTNQGLMAAHEAKQKKLGGELIAEIY
ncbi:MAG TPA: 30S ribosomal protein S8 [Candidatus Absconditabacterales bacterium]|nr:30S ribosomal protein S8 [Candidatus Absconditabacterales bacterium]HRU49996.1 30S ribosomal protein S8 [Candidatus Absconditabacterales bacterium]